MSNFKKNVIPNQKINEDPYFVIVSKEKFKAFYPNYDVKWDKNYDSASFQAHLLFFNVMPADVDWEKDFILWSKRDKDCAFQYISDWIYEYLNLGITEINRNISLQQGNIGYTSDISNEALTRIISKTNKILSRMSENVFSRFSSADNNKILTPSCTNLPNDCFYPWSDDGKNNYYNYLKQFFLQGSNDVNFQSLYSSDATVKIDYSYEMQLGVWKVNLRTIGGASNLKPDEITTRLVGTPLIEIEAFKLRKSDNTLFNPMEALLTVGNQDKTGILTFNNTANDSGIWVFHDNKGDIYLGKNTDQPIDENALALFDVKPNMFAMWKEHGTSDENGVIARIGNPMIKFNREVDLGLHKIINLAEPTADSDAATLKYVREHGGGGGGTTETVTALGCGNTPPTIYAQLSGFTDGLKLTEIIKRLAGGYNAGVVESSFYAKIDHNNKFTAVQELDKGAIILNGVTGTINLGLETDPVSLAVFSIKENKNFLIKDFTSEIELFKVNAIEVYLQRQINLNNHKIIHLADPQNEGDATNKKYVDGKIGGGNTDNTVAINLAQLPATSFVAIGGFADNTKLTDMIKAIVGGYNASVLGYEGCTKTQGDFTINGKWTFSGALPESPHLPTLAHQFCNKEYVDGKVSLSPDNKTVFDVDDQASPINSGLQTSAVCIGGQGTVADPFRYIQGEKIANVDNVVLKTTDQEIRGKKSFYPLSDGTTNRDFWSAPIGHSWITKITTAQSDASIAWVCQVPAGERHAFGLHHTTAGADDFYLKASLNLLMEGKKISNLGAPNAPDDAATKAYVDSQLGLFSKIIPVRVKTATTITAGGALIPIPLTNRSDQVNCSLVNATNGNIAIPPNMSEETFLIVTGTLVWNINNPNVNISLYNVGTGQAIGEAVYNNSLKYQTVVSIQALKDLGLANLPTGQNIQIAGASLSGNPMILTASTLEFRFEKVV